MLSKKKITKLLNKVFRKRIIDSVNWNGSMGLKKIPAYARYAVDSQIVHRSKEFADKKDAFYGFNPIYPLCAVMQDGTIDTRFIEFNIVNHFLQEMNGEAAVEVVICMLIEWCKENKQIKDFDIDVIDKELARVEREYLAKKAAEEKAKAEADKAAEAKQAEISATTSLSC